MEKALPPVYNLSEIQNNEKYASIGNYFLSKFGISPKCYVRVPGRVNLIGEHIDYCGFAVLPMAIEQDIVMAVATNDREELTLINLEFQIYEKFSAQVKDFLSDEFVINHKNLQWHHYFLCGYKGISQLKNFPVIHKGLDVVVKGTIPPASGLSSSSALVCAAALATSYMNEISLTSEKMASLCADFEKFIGTQGGGMDQAIGFLAEPGTAKLIEFNPLRTTNVPLPKGIAFVVSNSCVPMNKAASCQFNIRVVECKLAAKVLAKIHGFHWQSVEKLCEIPVLLEKTLSDMKDIVEASLNSHMYSRAEICQILEIDDDILKTFLTENTQHLENFQLIKRALHVFQEANRVLQFQSKCDTGGEDAILEIGKLMTESHKSCRDLYECSIPDLDELVQTALDAGAIGSRLTGAGWGGCCISMLKDNQVENFITTLKQNFYEKRGLSCQDSDYHNIVFLTKPGGGAAVYAE